MTVPRKTRTKATPIAVPSDAETLEAKRVRLLASLNLLGGIGLVIALPFALRAGAEFLLPVTAALVVAIALVPLLEWFERRGVGPRIAAGLCVIIFLAATAFAIASIVLPAIDWVAMVPEGSTGVGGRSRRCSICKHLESSSQNRIADCLVDRGGPRSASRTPNSMLVLLTAVSARRDPGFLHCVIYFFLSGWTSISAARSSPRSFGAR